MKLNKEDKGEGGGVELVVRVSDSDARVRVSLLTRFTMLFLEHDKFTPQK